MSKKKKNDSVLDAYNDLISAQYDDEHGLMSFNSSLSAFDDEDGESFITSKDIVKKKLKMEKKGRPVPADSGEIEESVIYRRQSRRREHKYTEKELRDIEEGCVMTIVHDYGEFDWYHLSDEERTDKDMLSEISLKLAGLKKSYRKIDQYIQAMRVVFEAWTILERHNYIHTKEEFFELVAEGKIVSNRIIMPKMRKLDDYNLDLVITYISNPELDPSHLAPISKSIDYGSDIFFDDQNWYEIIESNIYELLNVAELKTIDVEVIFDNIDFIASLKCYCDTCGPLPEKENLSSSNIWDIINDDEDKSDKEEDDRSYEIDLTDLEEIIEYDREICENILTAAKLIRMNKRKLDVEGRPETEKEIDYRILSPQEIESIMNPSKMEVGYIKTKYIKGYDKRRVGKKKKKGKGNKAERRKRESVAEILNKIQNNSHYKGHTATFSVTHNLFEPEKSQKSFFDKVYFDGSWADDTQVHLYDLALRNEMLQQRPIDQRYLTYGDLNIEKFFKILENNDVSTIELRKKMGTVADTVDTKKIKVTKKENKKKENMLLQRISELNKSKEFKKIVSKAEKALDNYKGEEED